MGRSLMDLGRRHGLLVQNDGRGTPCTQLSCARRPSGHTCTLRHLRLLRLGAELEIEKRFSKVSRNLDYETQAELKAQDIICHCEHPLATVTVPRNRGGPYVCDVEEQLRL